MTLHVKPVYDPHIMRKILPLVYSPNGQNRKNKPVNLQLYSDFTNFGRLV